MPLALKILIFLNVVGLVTIVLIALALRNVLIDVYLERFNYRFTHRWSRNGKDAATIRLVLDPDGISIEGGCIMSNKHIGDTKKFHIDGTNAGAALDLTNVKVSTSDATVATVSGSLNADNTVYSGEYTCVGIGTCSLDAEDLTADGQDVKASLGINVVAPATLEIVEDA
jgi:hypothetical protein